MFSQDPLFPSLKLSFVRPTCRGTCFGVRTIHFLIPDGFAFALSVSCHLWQIILPNTTVLLCVLHCFLEIVHLSRQAVTRVLICCAFLAVQSPHQSDVYTTQRACISLCVYCALHLVLFAASISNVCICSSFQSHQSVMKSINGFIHFVQEGTLAEELLIPLHLEQSIVLLVHR